MSLDLEYIKQQISSVNDTLQTISQSNAALFKKVTDLQVHLKNLEGAVKGNEELGFDGLVKRVKALEDFEKEVSKFKFKFMGAAFVVGIIWTIILQFAQNLMK